MLPKWNLKMVFMVPAAVAMLLTGIGAQTLQITGRVLEAADMSPVPGATVSWMGSNATATSDSLGNFTLTGSATAVESPFQFQSPYFHGDHFNITTTVANQSVAIRVFTVQGKLIASQAYTFATPGRNDLPVLPAEVKGSFMGFVQASSQGQTYSFKVLHQDSPTALTAADFVTARAPLSKTAALGNVIVSMAGLDTATASVNTANQNLGDIVLKYPPRTLIGVGAKPPYGSIMLFDGTKGRASALSQLQSLWKPWWRFNTGHPPVTQITFTIATDPQYPNDTNHVTLQTCCPNIGTWGYDDLQSKIVHGDAQLHVEWNAMGEYDNGSTAGTAGENPDSNSNCVPSQNPELPCYFNSGVYVQSRHEIQLESNPLPPAPINDPANGANHALGAIVGEDPPSSNQFLGNGHWEAYDITFRTTGYGPGHTVGDGRDPGDTMALMTVWWNGVQIHKNHQTYGAATGTSNHSGEQMNDTLYGLKLQNESGDVRFRNIWMKNLKIDSLGTNFGY